MTPTTTLTAPSATPAASEEHATRTIVVGIDGSDGSISALRWAARQAELTGAALRIICTWTWPNTAGWWNVVVPEEFDPRDGVQAVLDGALGIVAREHPSVNVTAEMVQDHPGPALTNASRGAELLVVGSRGHGEFVGMLLGSVSEYCAAKAHCPVVIFRAAA